MYYRRIALHIVPLSRLQDSTDREHETDIHAAMAAWPVSLACTPYM